MRSLLLAFVGGSCALGRGRPFGSEVFLGHCVVNARPWVIDRGLDLLAEPAVMGGGVVGALMRSEAVALRLPAGLPTEAPGANWAVLTRYWTMPSSFR